tara:strand:+ start:20174 stop:20407 length:234 start_codon:yes stop_codon:yes gene_type:complete
MSERKKAQSAADEFISETMLRDMEKQMRYALTKKGKTPQEKSDEVAFLRAEYATLKSEKKKGLHVDYLRRMNLIFKV